MMDWREARAALVDFAYVFTAGVLLVGIVVAVTHAWGIFQVLG